MSQERIQCIVWIRYLAIAALLLAAAAGSAQDKIKLPVSVSSKTLGYSPLWVAQKQGFFAANGLDVDLILVRSGDLALMALLGGSVHISGGSTAGISAVEKGVDLAFIGGAINGLTHMILGGKHYKSIDDLRGATIGASGLTGSTTLVLKRILKEKGLEYPRDYKLLNVGASAPAFLALTSNQIAASIIAVPLAFEAADLGYNTLARVVDTVPSYQLGALALKRSWGEKNRPVAVRFMKSMAQAHRWLYSQRDAAVSFLAKEMQLSASHARRGWEYYTEKRIWHPDADLSHEGLRMVIQVMAEEGQLRPPLPAPQKFVDQSYLKEALQELASR